MRTHPLSPPLDGLLSTLGGWAGGVVLLVALDVIRRPSEALDWLIADVFGSILCVPLLFALWMLLWGLLTLVPLPSLLWHPLLCVPVGAAVGSGLLYLYGLVLHSLSLVVPDPVPFDPFFNLGVLLGGTAFGTLCLLKRFRR